MVVDIGGIGGGHDFESDGNVIGHGQAELQAERKDALCKAKGIKIKMYQSLSSFFMNDSNVREVFTCDGNCAKPRETWQK